MLSRHIGNFRWENVPLLDYKEEGTHFKNISRQVLFDGLADVSCQLRYFEIAPGGYSTLEQHQHVHLVAILRGEGDVLIGEEIHHVKEHDILVIPSATWHQFQATADNSFGFFCIVNTNRDRPTRPSKDDLQLLRQRPEIAAFIRS
jgi:S-methyl-1-thioxylulose 5-phosphate methylthiotransferase